MTDSNIFKKLQAIQDEAPILRKIGQLEMGGKKIPFLQVDEILDKLRGLFTKHGVVVIPRLVEHDSHIKYGPEQPSSTPQPSTESATFALKMWNGKIPTVKIREHVIYDFTFYDSDNPESNVTARVSGEAMDTQDKASGKAFTSAYKSMLIKTFMLVTGDPEIEDETIKDEPASVEKRNSGQQKIDAAKPGGKPSISTNANPAQAPAEIPEGSIDAAKSRLRAAMEASAKAGVAYSKVMVDAVGKDVTGKDREAWIGSIRDINAIAAAIESGQVA